MQAGEEFWVLGAGLADAEVAGDDHRFGGGDVALGQVGGDGVHLGGSFLPGFAGVTAGVVGLQVRSDDVDAGAGDVDDGVGESFGGPVVRAAASALDVLGPVDDGPFAGDGDAAVFQRGAVVAAGGAVPA